MLLAHKNHVTGGQTNDILTQTSQEKHSEHLHFLSQKNHEKESKSEVKKHDNQDEKKEEDEEDHTRDEEDKDENERSTDEDEEDDDNEVEEEIVDAPTITQVPPVPEAISESSIQSD